MHAPPKSKDIPTATPETLQGYDGFLFGVPTRYGNFPAQWKAFWDSTGKQWQTGGYWGKYGGVFVSTGGPGGGQESTVISSLSTLAHHGIIYVPLGYATTFALLTDLSEIHGGSPWGAGTFAVSLTPNLTFLPFLFLLLLLISCAVSLSVCFAFFLFGLFLVSGKTIGNPSSRLTAYWF